MNGRLEKEIAAQAAMDKKLEGIPEVFKNYYMYLRAARKTYSTLTVYVNNAIHFAKFVTNNKLTNEFYKNISVSDIESYLVSLETTTKNGQVVRTGTDILCSRWSSLNTFFEFLVRRGYRTDNPVSMTTRPKNTTSHEVTYLNKKEIKALLGAAEQHPNIIMGQRNKTILSLAIASGMRSSALVGINIEDINFDEKYISVIEKGNKIRRIDIGEATINVLGEWIKIRNKMKGAHQTNALFLSQKGNRISGDAINDMIKTSAKEAGIKKKLTCHKMRSTMACASLDANVPLLAISQRLGHNNLATTQRYLTARDADKEKLTNFLDNLF